MDIRKEVLEEKDIFIVDQAIQPEEVESFYDITTNLDFRRQERSNDKDQYPIFSVDFIPDRFEQEMPIGIKARQLLEDLIPDEHFDLYRAYINMCHYGDMEYPHRDCRKDAKDITVLYYVNRHWDYEWGGETKFYEKGETRLAVLPKPGRFLIFRGAVEHIGSIPTRVCNISRFTLALKYISKRNGTK